MRTVPACLALMGLLLLGACLKDQDDAGYRAADIEFKSDSGYTYLNDTLPAGDSIRVGVTVTEGSERLYTFLVDRKYDNGPVQHIDTLPMHVKPFHLDTVLLLRDVPGVERWTFIAVEGNGDRTQRHLSITTQ